LNRGKTAPELFADLPKIILDRETDAVLESTKLKQDWDTVIDLCAFYPKDVARITQTLHGRAGRYVLCSTLSAYRASTLPGPTPIIDEDSELQSCSSEEAVDRTLITYGQRKAECERVAMAQHHAGGIPTVILRPCLVYGPFDHTDRFAYWIWRASRSEPFILPEGGLTIIRRTYAPDLAQAFVLAVTAKNASGRAYNIAESDPLSFRDTLYWIGKHLGTHPLNHAIPVSSEVLLKEKIKQWIDFPSWLAQTNLLVDTFRSRHELGFMSTPTKDAIAKATDAFLAEKREPKAGLTLAAEAALISKLSKTKT
jgi:nucleoside-diphosphate-sugar epimerase